MLQSTRKSATAKLNHTLATNLTKGQANDTFYFMISACTSQNSMQENISMASGFLENTEEEMGALRIRDKGRIVTPSSLTDIVSVHFSHQYYIISANSCLNTD